jgi:hypothetical protein
METKEKLEGLANLMFYKESLALEQKTLIDSAMPAEVLAKINDIKEEFAPKIEAVDKNIEALTASVKEEVAASGATLNTQFLQAVYIKPRVTWDTSVLDTMVEFYPKIAAARKVGAASVAIKKR